ncbi:MAG: AbiV family abortive infection protein [Fluviicola sp.]|nr:AbiV family abortive infection protein [Fluviicola sp.]
MNFPEKTYNAIFQSLQNAKDLYEDGKILDLHGRLPRAYTLYHFSFEETGRAFILSSLFLDYILKELDYRDFIPKRLNERGYIDHQKKLNNATFEFSKFAAYASILGNRNDLIDKIQKLYDGFEIGKMDENKNKSIYLSFSKNEFLIPSDGLSEDDLNEMKILAEINLNFVELVVQTFENEGGYKNIVQKYRK